MAVRSWQHVAVHPDVVDNETTFAEKISAISTCVPKIALKFTKGGKEAPGNQVDAV